MEYDVVIIGAGIVGLSVGFNLLKKRPGLKIAILEKEKTISTHQSGRNSGVIHSGIYYKPGSLKAVNCKEGYLKLIDFCEKHRITFDICGKIIVATSKKEIPSLMKIYERGLENGLSGIKLLNRDEIIEKEPFVRGQKAIWVPQAGIVDYKEVAEKLSQILSEKSCDILLDHKVIGITDNGGTHIINCGDKTINTSYIVNCAGLYSDKIAKMQGVKMEAKIIPFKGEYYLLKDSKKHLVNNLIYPVPNPAFPFLGVHFTRRINGSIDAGPNAVLAFKREGYKKLSINFAEFFEIIFYKGFVKIAIRYIRVGSYELYRSLNKAAFARALQKLVPEIRSNDLIPARPGIRAQLCDDNGNLIDDFMIKHGNRAVHVLNAPSPAATSSLQIGETIANKVFKIL